MKIDHLDHLVLTVGDIDATCKFYAAILDLKVQVSINGRKSLLFGNQKINLHQLGQEIDPKASFPTPGSGDLCFIANTPVEELLATLSYHNIPLELGGIVQRTGAVGAIRSVYFRDPDGNLIEVSNYF